MSRASPANRADSISFASYAWELKYSGELKLKGIAALSNMKACDQAKWNVMLLKNKYFRDLNQPG